MLRHLQLLAVLGLYAAPLVAQGNPFEELGLRVATLRPNGQCVVDRGKRDLVEVDDRVVLMPINARSLTGRVIQVDERTALVQLQDPRASVPVGTRGHVVLPKARIEAARPQPVEPPDVTPVDPEARQAEEQWVPGMPLLGRRRPPQPSERPSQVRGRVYGAANLVSTLGEFDQSYFTAGVDVDINNVDGDGGRVRFHGEYVNSVEFNGNRGDDLRVYDFSYAHGGTRFDAFRWQVGRFLQQDMPEFGLLDGIEVGYRTEGGDRYGASLGYLPELDDDMQSLADLQVAAWYIWNQDVAERVQFGIGYQKSWHRGTGDRDLFVVKTRYLPNSGWDLSSAIWVDLYDGNDDLKNESFEITRANVFASRRWQGEGGIELFYDHEEYPDLLRNDNPQTILPLTLIEAHVDRVSARMWVDSDDATRWFTRITGWVDEQREGGAGEFGIELAGLWGERTRSVLALYSVQGLTSTVTGARIEYGSTSSFGRLDMLYELGFVHHEGFPDDRDDLLQHRLGGILTTDFGAGWDATFFGDVTIWDSEVSFGVGLYLQRLF